MAIKIPKKPSNKPKTHPENALQVDLSPAKGHSSVGEYIPFIDKLSLIIKPENEEHAHQIHSNIWKQFADKDVFQFAGADASKGYQSAQLIALASTHHRPLLQYRSDGKLAHKLRLELNPRKIGFQGLVELHSVLTSVIPDGWPYVIEHGRISRIDVAVDIPDVRMDEFLFLPEHPTKVMRWLVNGHLESLTHGVKKANQTLIYSIKKKRLAKAQPWAGKSVIRVERRLRKPKEAKLAELATMQNPFASLVMTENIPGPPAGEKDWQWSMFQDSVNVRGLACALALLPSDRRTKYRQHLKKHQQPWWHPKAIWDNWPGMLESLKLDDPKAFK